MKFRQIEINGYRVYFENGIMSFYELACQRNYFINCLTKSKDEIDKITDEFLKCKWSIDVIQFFEKNNAQSIPFI
jgi:hypothetical protein